MLCRIRDFAHQSLAGAADNRRNAAGWPVSLVVKRFPHRPSVSPAQVISGTHGAALLSMRAATQRCDRSPRSYGALWNKFASIAAEPRDHTVHLAIPDHSTLSRRAETLAVAGPPSSAESVHLLVDSTGLKLSGAGEWLVEKHGSRRRSWRKLHIGVDADTGRIVAAT